MSAKSFQVTAIPFQEQNIKSHTGDETEVAVHQNIPDMAHPKSTARITWAENGRFKKIGKLSFMIQDSIGKIAGFSAATAAHPADIPHGIASARLPRKAGAIPRPASWGHSPASSGAADCVSRTVPGNSGAPCA